MASDPAARDRPRQERRMWTNGERPARNYVVTRLRDCVCWADPYRLAKWLWADRVLDRSPKLCRASLAHWAWASRADDADESPAWWGERCAKEGRECGSCYCGKFRTPAVPAPALAP